MTVEAVISAIHEQGPQWADRSAVADESGSIASDTATEIQSLGAHRMLQPADFGGEQASIEAHMRVVAAVGEYCIATAWCTSVWSVHNWMTAMLPVDGQAEVWQDPAALTSASIVPKVPLEVAGDDVIIQGRFPFASGCDHATWLGVGGIAQWDDPTPVICLVPASAATIDHESWNVTGLRGTGSKDFVIDTPLRVPARRYFRPAHAMTRQAPGQSGDGRALYRIPFRAAAIIVLAAPVIGAAKAALRRFQERLDGHVLMTRKGSQRADPAAGLRLAESAADAHAAELVLLDASRRLDAMAAISEPDAIDVASTIRDTAYAVRLCAAAIDRLYEASGGTALWAGEPMQRYWRDAHAARSHAVLTWDAAATAYGEAVLNRNS